MKISNVGRVTVSFGVSGYCLKYTIDTLIKKADDMMYKAKNEGRNCVRYVDECKQLLSMRRIYS
ncbi:diguanylate cyclase domain-containing protein [Caminicella sporogenes]|uniref:diguanylate cyclase domain-containing protein n=1 Tax=Caminicella sporogenes TaxID=166485 RepID=UPI00253FB1E0|nr:diguanylate cyclase [Caminicella sporogenes]WIF95204.1 diguanylate cyclase [Caminicella sporogenes]